MVHRKISSLFGVGVLMVCLSAPEAEAACNSGPDYCTDDPRIPSLLAEKKERLSRDYPQRLVGLLDRGVQCVARVRQSPDSFHILEFEADGDSLSIPWNEDAERIAKERMAGGVVSHYWIVNARRAFQCDGEKPYDQRLDYVRSDDVNSKLAIRCALESECK